MPKLKCYLLLEFYPKSKKIHTLISLIARVNEIDEKGRKSCKINKRGRRNKWEKCKRCKISNKINDKGEFCKRLTNKEERINMKKKPDDPHISWLPFGTKNHEMWGPSVVASSNAHYQLGNQLFVKRSQYIRIENPLHKQSERVCMCF